MYQCALVETSSGVLFKHLLADVGIADEEQGWLYNTSHVTVSYSLRYDGVEIEQLPPGTRAIVLLLLYVAVDRIGGS